MGFIGNLFTSMYRKLVRGNCYGVCGLLGSRLTEDLGNLWSLISGSIQADWGLDFHRGTHSRSSRRNNQM